MTQQKFHIVDVFAEEAYSGNQLAVFLDGEQYDDDMMQRLTREMNFSESTFIMGSIASEQADAEATDTNPVTRRVRIFTPGGELPFAGHPTLGSAYIIAKELIRRPVAQVVLDLKAGRIPVDLEYDDQGEIIKLTMRQLPPTFGRQLDPAKVAALLGLPIEALDSRYPPQEVSTGVPFLIVPLRDLAAMDAMRPQVDLMNEVLVTNPLREVLAFCPETYSSANRLNSRVFVVFNGNLVEDPATGSAAGCLTAYLLHHNYLDTSDFAVRMEQGVQLGSPSVLYLQGKRDAAGYEILVGGKVQHIAEGHLRQRPA